MTESTAVSPPGEAPEGKRQSKHRPRRVVAWVLVVLVSILVPLSVVAVWSVNTINNTDHYVATVAPIARNETITNAIANRATVYLFDQSDATQRIAGVLPKKAAPLAPVISNGLRTYTYNVVAQVLHSDRFGTLWDRANRQLHSHLVDFLTGKNQSKVEKARAVAVNLTPVLIMSIDKLDGHGITTFDSLKARLQTGQRLSFTLANNAQVRKLRSGLPSGERDRLGPAADNSCPCHRRHRCRRGPTQDARAHGRWCLDRPRPLHRRTRTGTDVLHPPCSKFRSACHPLPVGHRDALFAR